MSGLPYPVQVLWIDSLLAQLGVLVALVTLGNFRKVPFFSGFVALNLAQGVFLMVLYSLSGLAPTTVAALAWNSEVVTMVAQALATTEILGITLKVYPGIWGLGWRAIIVTSAVMLILIALATWDHWANARWFELNRGYHLVFSTAVIACLLLIRYYGIPVHGAYKLILSGFCIYSCTEVLINTILQAMFYRHFAAYAALWQFATMFAFLVAQAFWLVALRRKLPETEPALSLEGSDAIAQQLSPQINEQLRELNDKLKKLWKLEANPN